MKKLITFLLIFSIMLSQLSITALAGSKRDDFYLEYNGKTVAYKSKVVTVNIDGKTVETGDMPGVIIDGRTLVPAREVFESDAIKAKVDWNQKSKEVTIKYGTKTIKLKIGSKTAYINNKAVELDVPANLIRDTSKESAKTMIPLRFVTENLGYDVTWNQRTYTAKITTSNSPDVETNNPIAPLPTPLKANPIIWTGQEDKQGLPLTTEEHPETKLIAAEYDSSKQSFRIDTSSEISKAVSSIWSGKYIVDIYNSTYGIDNNLSYKKVYTDNPYVTEVNASQQPDKDGVKVTRVVFTLKDASKAFELSLNENRKELILNSVTNSLTRIELGQNEKGDYLLVKGNIAPSVSAFRLSGPERLVLDLNNMKTAIGSKEADNVKGQFADAIRTAPFGNGTRITIETSAMANYQIAKIDSTTTIVQLTNGNLGNISLDDSEEPTIIFKAAASKVKLSGVTYQDDYLNKKFVIQLAGNYESVFQPGTLEIKNEAIENIQVSKNSAGNTKITISEKNIYVFRLEADDENVYLKAYKPKQIYSKIVFIDVGHGGDDPGATREHNGIVYQEKKINLAMATYLKEYLSANSDIKFYYSRTTDTTVALGDRTPIANDVEADFLISIHNNASTSPTASGTETLYFQDADIPGLNSVELAAIVQKHVLQAAGLNNRKIKADNGLRILRTSAMPSVIVEVGFMSNAEDIKVISNPTVQKKVALGIYNAIVEVFSTYPTNR